MGRFIGICILSDIKFIKVSPKREEVAKVFSESIFDYSKWDDEHKLSLRDDLPGSEIAELRIRIHECIGYERPRKSNSILNRDESAPLDTIISGSTISELRDLASKKEYQTFQESRDVKFLLLDGHTYQVETFSFLVFLSGYKFYPTSRYFSHEVTERIELLLGSLLQDNRLMPLVKCVITL